jgi:hypothetical protein
MTFAGTLAANVVTVAVVAAAIIAARHFVDPGSHVTDVPLAVAETAALLAFYVASITVFMSVFRRRFRTKPGKRLATVTVVVTWGAAATLLMLVLLGAAAGVK